jgi:hypothetical protein
VLRVVSLGAPTEVLSVAFTPVLSADMPASWCTAVLSLEGCPMVLSVAAALVVSVATAVVSPRFGAAPTSSSDRLWQAASSEAAAASVKRCLMNCSSSEGTLPA